MTFKSVVDESINLRLHNDTKDTFGLQKWLLYRDPDSSEHEILELHLSACNLDSFNCKDGIW